MPKLFKFKNMKDMVSFIEELPARITEAAQKELKPQAEGIAQDFRDKAEKHSLQVKLSPEAAKEAGPVLSKYLTSVSKEYIASIKVEEVGDKVRVGVSDDKIKNTNNWLFISRFIIIKR